MALIRALVDPTMRPQVIASSEESQNHWQQKDYKGFHSSTDWDTADFSKVAFGWWYARACAGCGVFFCDLSNQRVAVAPCGA